MGRLSEGELENELALLDERLNPPKENVFNITNANRSTLERLARKYQRFRGKLRDDQYMDILSQNLSTEEFNGLKGLDENKLKIALEELLQDKPPSRSNHHL